MSELTDAIARARRQIARDEAPIRRQLWRAYRDALDALNADLDAVTAMIVEARRAGVDVSPDWLRRQARYRMLIADAEREFARFATTGARIIAEGQRAAVSGGAHSATQLMQAAGVPVAVTGFGARVNVPAVERLVSALQPGSPVRIVLDAYGPAPGRWRMQRGGARHEVPAHSSRHQWPDSSRSHLEWHGEGAVNHLESG